MKLVGVTFLGISAVSGFTLPFLKKLEKKQPEPLKFDDDFNRAFDQMDQALKRAFAIPLFNPVPVLEADIYHMPDGNEFMTPLRQANTFSQLFGFNPLSRPYYPSNERFLKLGDTDDQEEQSHDENSHSTTTKHKITENLMDRLTGKSGLKTTKTTDIVSDDGHSQVHMVVSSFDMDGEENEKQAEKEEVKMANKEYSVEAEKVFNGKIRPGKTYGFSVEDLKEREFERQKYVDNMINKWHSLLNGPFPGNEKTSEDLDELESILNQKKELEEKIKQLNVAEKLIKDKMVEQDKVENLEVENKPEVIDVVPAEDHVTFVSSENKDLEDDKEDVEAENIEEKHEVEKVGAEPVVEGEKVVEPVKSLKSLKKKVASKHPKRKSRLLAKKPTFSKKNKKH